MTKIVKENPMKNYLNFGSLCCLLRELTRKKRLWKHYDYEKNGKIINNPTQRDVVNTVCLLVVPQKELDTMGSVSDKAASMICNNLDSIHIDYQLYASRKNAKETIRENLVDRILLGFSNTQREIFWSGLKNLILLLPDNFAPNHLKDYTRMEYPAFEKEQYYTIVAECVYWCFNSPNEIEEVPNTTPLSKIPYNIYTYDPHNFVNQYSKSTALRMVIREENCDKKIILYDGYNYEKCLDYILQNSLIIKKIDGSLGIINMICLPHENNLYHLKRVEPTEYKKIRAIIYYHLEEYCKKKCWKMDIHDMVYNGLKSERWTAYAYYNHSGDIVSFLDYKIRTDGDFELGTQLTVKQDRRHYLATGLINFFRFRFMSACFFAGTYEENEPMKHVFEITGFRKRYFTDPDTNKVTSFIKERINPEFPDDDSKMTNSVYYHASSLLAETRLGAISLDGSTNRTQIEDK